MPEVERARRASGGFTLIEVLAAVFLTAIVISVAVAFQVQLGDATTRAREIIRGVEQIIREEVEQGRRPEMDAAWDSTSIAEEYGESQRSKS